MRFRRGDIVWARVVYPQKWWPGLLSRIDNLGVSVSFFNIEKPRHLLESEVCSFEENFESLVKTLKCSTGLELLDQALKMLARRVVSSLKCPCQYPLLESASAMKRACLRGGLFRADAVLRFVLRLAVSPSVEDSEFVYSVTVAAQFLVFRRFLVTQQKLSLLEVQKSGTSELEVDPLPEVPPKTGSWTLTEQTSVQSCREMLVNLHCPAVDASYLRGECFNTVKQNWLMPRNLSYPGLFNLRFQKCSRKSIEVQFAYPWCIKSRLIFEVDGKGDREIFGPLTPDMINPINFMRSKRLHDQPADSGFSYKLRKAMPLSSMDRGHRADAYLQKSETDCKVCMYDASISAPKLSDHAFKFCNALPFSSFYGEDTHLQQNRTAHDANMFGAFSSGSHLDIETQIYHSSRAQRLTFESNSGIMHLVQRMFNICRVNYTSCDSNTYTSCDSNTLELSTYQEKEENVDTLNNNRTCMHFVKMQEPGASTSALGDGGTFIAVDSDAIEKTTNCIQTADVRDDCKIIFPQPSATESMLTFAMKTHCNNDEIGKTSAATSNHLQSQLTADQIQMEPGNSDDATSLEINRGLSMTAAFGDGSMNNKKLFQSDASDLSFKPQVSQQSVLGTFANSKSLHMKFPQGFRLPSKVDLIKKFSGFGRVDSLRTKTFSCMGSYAKVVFLHELDAVAAYQYHKRKKSLFGEAKVLLWLDPFEHKRRGSKFQHPMPALTGEPKPPNLKSCLKKSSPHVKEDKKCTQKVRFIMET